MRTLREFIGFVFCSSFYIQLGYSFQGRFTEQPTNITAKEGQNIEMACAFQSVMPSVYLEMQWWFLRIPEERDYEEEDADSQMDITPESDPDYEGIKISTVRVQGNDISHRLHISKVGKSDEGLYECRVTNANYGELLEYKALAYLQVTSSVQLRSDRPNKTSPLHLTDKKPRKTSSGLTRDGKAGSENQRLNPTSNQQTTASTALRHSTTSGTKIATSHGFAVLLLVYGAMKGTFL